MVVQLYNGLRRTVASVSDSGYVNYRDEPILTVRYREPASVEWSGGNTGHASGLWQVIA